LNLNHQSIYQVCTKIIKTIDGNIRPYEKHQGCYKIHLWKHAKENSPHHISEETSAAQNRAANENMYYLSHNVYKKTSQCCCIESLCVHPDLNIVELDL
jgi:hypothetical protein